MVYHQTRNLIDPAAVEMSYAKQVHGADSNKAFNLPPNMSVTLALGPALSNN